MGVCQENGLYEDKGYLGLMWNHKSYLTPFRYGLNNTWEFAFNTRKEPNIPQGDDQYFFNVKPPTNDEIIAEAESGTTTNTGW